ncbi:MAG TPA: GAF domain-containing protein, partial [Anaerolineales bacterium]|nr:GAF domain-containing protein [Anaerolineales bacterium]
VVFGTALFIGRTSNHQAGSVILVSGIILAGFVITTSIRDDTLDVLILVATIVPALTIAIPLIPLIAIIIICVITVISIGILPLMAIVNVGAGLLLFISLILIESVFILISRFQEVAELHQTDELVSLRGRLEERVEERTRFARIAADITRDLASSSSQEELLTQTANLIKGRFGLAYTGIYLADEVERYTLLKAAQGSMNVDEMVRTAKRIPYSSATLIGWVAENKQMHVASRIEEDSLQLDANFIQDCQSGIAIPILSGDLLIGILEAQSTRTTFFDNETIVVLQMLADQIAAAIQNVRHIEIQRGSVEEVAEIYQVISRIAQAKSEIEINEELTGLFSKGNYVTLFLTPHGNELKTSAATEKIPDGQHAPDTISVQINELEPFLSSDIFIAEGNRLSSLPYDLVRVIRHLEIFSAAILPVSIDNNLEAILLLGTREKIPLSTTEIEPYISLAQQIAASFDRIHESQSAARRIAEMETITLFSQEISTVHELHEIYKTLHGHVRQILGDENFLIAIYTESTNSIAVPYMYEKGAEGSEISTLEPFPLGEGLTSILIRTKQPLMLVEDMDRRAAALGVKITGKASKSWLGTPLVVSGQVIGAIVVQDPEREHAFSDEDMHFLTTLAVQVAGAIYNTRLLEETDSRAIQLQTAAEIARDISGSLDLGELLAKAVSLIRERFNYYHAAIFLVDPANEFAVIREATGEAGTQMKRAGHKLKIGSKSIVGFVTGSGEPLIVNDTSREATYFANPLLPETRSEVAIPLKVGQRILGALDVQSTQPFSFGEEDMSVLRILADQMAIAVINSELFADTQEHLSQHRLLHHVTTAAASGTTLEESLNSATQGLQVTLGGDRVSILLADKETKKLKVKAFAGYSEDVEQLEIPYGEGITGWVAIHQQPQRINDVTQDARYIQVGSNIRSELAIPLTYRGDLLGVLNVESDQIGAYNENDEELLGTLGGSLAAIISNARLLEQVRRQVDRERMLYEVTSKIRRSTDMQTIMATTTSELSKVLGARRAEIKMNVDDESKDNPVEKSG